MEEGGDETWKDMEGHHAVLCVRAFYVRAGPTDDQEHMIALGDSFGRARRLHEDML